MRMKLVLVALLAGRPLLAQSPRLLNDTDEVTDKRRVAAIWVSDVVEGHFGPFAPILMVACIDRDLTGFLHSPRNPPKRIRALFGTVIHRIDSLQAETKRYFLDDEIRSLPDDQLMYQRGEPTKSILRTRGQLLVRYPTIWNETVTARFSMNQAESDSLLSQVYGACGKELPEVEP